MDEFGEDEDQEEQAPLSRKEFAKAMRRKAYLKAKERRATDPRYIEMKERAKETRRKEYQRQKEFLKSKQNKKKNSESVERVEERDHEQEAKDRLLREKIKAATSITKGHLSLINAPID